MTLSVADELAPSLHASTRRWRVRVPARSEVRVSTAIRPIRRGRFEPSRVVVRSEGPLGLAARQRTVDVPGRLKVVPAFPSRKDAELRLARAQRLELGVRSVRMLGTGTDFDQLREYTPDDDFRRIDWAATARGGRPIVRVYRAERNQTVLLLVEVGRNMAGRVAGVPRLEHALDAAFALTTVATGLQDQVGLVAYDDRVRASLPPSHRADQLAQVVEAVYELEPELLETDHLAAFSHTLARFRRRTTLVICTDLTEATVTGTLLPALPLVLRDHLVMIVAVHRSRGGGLGRRAGHRRRGPLPPRPPPPARWRSGPVSRPGCEGSARSWSMPRPGWSPAVWPMPTSPPAGEGGCDRRVRPAARGRGSILDRGAPSPSASGSSDQRPRALGQPGRIERLGRDPGGAQLLEAAR